MSNIRRIYPEAMSPNRISHGWLIVLFLREKRHTMIRINKNNAETPVIHQLMVRTKPIANPPIKKKNDIEAKLVFIQLSSTINLFIALSVFSLQWISPAKQILPLSNKWYIPQELEEHLWCRIGLDTPGFQDNNESWQLHSNHCQWWKRSKQTTE